MTVRLIDTTTHRERTLQAVCDDDGWRGGIFPYETNQAHSQANTHNAEVHGVGPLAPDAGRKSSRKSRDAE